MTTIGLDELSGGSSGVPLGGLARLTDKYPATIELDGATYLKNGFFLEGGYEASLEPYAKTGDFWQSLDTPEFAGGMQGIATDGNGVWISIGNTGYMIRSADDGATWNVVDSAMGGETAYRIATDGSGTWVAVGRQGLGVRSTDNGLTWNPVSLNAGSVVMYHVDTDKNGVWVATGVSDTRVRSVDNGVTWVKLPVISQFNVTAVHYSNGTWVAGNSNGYIQRSVDNGVTWVEIGQISTSFTISGLASSGDGVWLVVGGSGKAFRSVDDGLTWKAVVLSIGNLSSYDVGYSNGVWIITHITYGTTGTNILRSEDGVNWDYIVSTTSVIYQLASDGVTWMAAAQAGNVIKSTKGVSLNGLTDFDYMRVL